MNYEQTSMALDDPAADLFDGPVVTNRDMNSQAAARQHEPQAATSRRRIWLLIRAHQNGLACWEAEQLTGGLHQSVSATINWLWNHGWLVRVGFNKTPSNRRAYIYKAVRPLQETP